MKITIDVDPLSKMAQVKCDTAIERVMLIRILLSVADSLVASVDQRSIITPAGVPVSGSLFPS